MHDTDKTWKYFGETDPYFGVLTQQDFTSERMTEAGRAQFFESGKRYIDFVLQVVRDHLSPGFSPRRALDFGCGVGRLTLPLAAICESVVGVDVSEPMLAESRKNAAERGATNVSFVPGDDALSAVEGTFDLLNSLIVFQHIPPERGERIVQQLVGRLREGGVGALQFTYAFESGVSRSRTMLVEAYKTVPYLWNARNLVKGRPFQEPMMQMNQYSLNRLLRILQENGCHLAHLRFTETGSFGQKFYGVIIFFQKKSLDTAAHA
ncbi:MAG TPA: class I SAM-dependent methyltransferase [Polyangiaceae bacterium]|nr:class I SAM-dependent methyltransferase [Polyangiaceae bacterium]